jgi:uncharacterized glyoxalase superfamily protein PhnB
MTGGIVFTQLNLVVRNMTATVEFYRELGLPVVAEPGAEHVALKFPNGLLLQFDTTEFVRQWDSSWREPTGGGAVLGFSVESREAVDMLYNDLTASGHSGHQVPYDTFWGARYAMVEDPDGHPVGIMSPVDNERKFWPPTPPPSGG